MQKIFTLKYGNTNTYLVGSLLIDTDMPGTLPALRRDWDLILSKGAEAIYYGHANMQSKPRACFVFTVLNRLLHRSDSERIEAGFI